MEYTIRAIAPRQQAIVQKMVYHAIYVPPGGSPPPPGIVRHPTIARYVDGWGRPGDKGFVAIAVKTGQPVGACWIRLFTADAPGFGFVAADIPELTIAVLPGFRGEGLGTNLLVHLIGAARGRHPALSLSVQAGNPARRLYQRLGFREVAQHNTALTMQLDL